MSHAPSPAMQACRVGRPCPPANASAPRRLRWWTTCGACLIRSATIASFVGTLSSGHRVNDRPAVALEAAAVAVELLDAVGEVRAQLTQRRCSDRAQRSMSRPIAAPRLKTSTQCSANATAPSSDFTSHASGSGVDVLGGRRATRWARTWAPDRRRSSHRRPAAARRPQRPSSDARTPCRPSSRDPRIQNGEACHRKRPPIRLPDLPEICGQPHREFSTDSPDPVSEMATTGQP